MPIAEKNKGSMNAMDTYAEVARYGLCSTCSEGEMLTREAPMLASIFLMMNEIMIEDLTA